MAINSSLRDYQITAINSLFAEIRGGSMRPVLQMPTGSGKTITAAQIIAMALDKGRRVAFVVPAISLVDQTVGALWQEGIDAIGVQQADHDMTDHTQPVQVCSIQTLARRGYPEADCVIVDECHINSEFRDQWMADPAWQSIPFIGLSATPWAAGMAKHWTSLTVMATTAQMIEWGYLSKFEVFAPSHPDLSGVKIVAGDYQENQLADVMKDSELVADIVETWKKLGGDQPTLCFCVNLAHARCVYEAFMAAGVPAAYQDARTPREDRESIARDFERGDIRVVCNVGTLTTGVDWDVRCLILARPTKSKILFTQIVGRALRTAPGKDAARILDHSDTHLRLGLVTDIHADRLSDGKRMAGSSSADREEPLPKECGRCAFLKPAGVRECPNCGHVAQPVSTVETANGELQKINGKGKFKAKKYTADERRDWYAQALGWCREHGKKPGMAYHAYKGKFDLNPANPKPLPKACGAEVRSYMQHKLIAYAKKMAKQKAQVSA